MSKIYIVLRNSKWTEKRPVSKGNGFFKELVPVITSFVKHTKKEKRQLVYNQLIGVLTSRLQGRNLELFPGPESARGVH